MIHRRNSSSNDSTSSLGSNTPQWNYLQEEDMKDSLVKFKYAYLETLNKLIRFDKQKIFRFPVDTKLVPDYMNYITTPMDFETMLAKNEENKYKEDIRVFEADIWLIINNCKTYNSRDTIFYEAAVKLQDFYLKIKHILERKIVTITNLINRKRLSTSRARQRQMLSGSMSPSESGMVMHPYAEKTYNPMMQQSQFLKPNPMVRPTVMKTTPMPKASPMMMANPPVRPTQPQPEQNDSSQPIARSTSNSSAGDNPPPTRPTYPKTGPIKLETESERLEFIQSRLEPVKRRKRKPDPKRFGNGLLNSTMNTIQIALSVSGLTNETFGKLMANFNGLPRLLNSLDVAQHQLLVNPQSRNMFGARSINRLRRIINSFEWKRSFDFPISMGKNTLYRKIQLLMGRYKRETYKKSVESFIGQENLELVNEVFPNLSNILSDLCIPYQMLSNSTEFKN
ncbi:Bromodomain-containing protein 1 [Theileria orientalis]|uniref:Bromodomain-containing protein 1 n=1 Tax=Theileria orientalis TaxID=68886 RepID=A0A976XIU6_THEOR|nr:Bromodomain-containing protein 1 [Theileria orientalis]